MSRSVAGVVAGLVLALSACSGGRATFDPGVPGPTAWHDLSMAQAQKICANTRAFEAARLGSATSREQACRASGLFLASVVQGISTDEMARQACRGNYMLCEAFASDGGAPTFSGNGISDVCAATYAGAADCTATVAQFSACVDERFAVTGYPSCDELTVAEVQQFSARDGGTFPGLTIGPACAAFMEACPNAPIPTSVPIVF
jgi:hypothetical protein